MIESIIGQTARFNRSPSCQFPAMIAYMICNSGRYPIKAAEAVGVQWIEIAYNFFISLILKSGCDHGGHSLSSDYDSDATLIDKKNKTDDADRNGKIRRRVRRPGIRLSHWCVLRIPRPS